MSFIIYVFDKHVYKLHAVFYEMRGYLRKRRLSRNFENSQLTVRSAVSGLTLEV